MRGSRSVATMTLALGLAFAASGCDAVNEATNAANSVGDAANKVQLCVDAVRLMGFTPDLSNPQAAVDDAHKKAEEMTKLAEQAGDTTLKQALTDASTQLSSVTLSDLDPASGATWLQQKLDKLNALNSACAS
ncbi:bacteriophage spanin2 family protein [Umezawaea sp. Da 62-37]|uniref:bacteriophage spanin2 family protein n=1 Tax=Umezawaea sp. Da 62-37 TaxID=3075927 RepID=UPI0028F70CF4|nr:bacteriophage spanin2 family protein [Umezawaea sp. Da 62-37]WNV90754.1 bacteriophage spanin2 family protein [Umezawaea sp. Da 62-37]